MLPLKLVSAGQAIKLACALMGMTKSLATNPPFTNTPEPRQTNKNDVSMMTSGHTGLPTWKLAEVIAKSGWNVPHPRLFLNDITYIVENQD
jgi:hypothetical protein